MSTPETTTTNTMKTTIFNPFKTKAATVVIDSSPKADGTETAVIYHQTAVVKFATSGQVWLNSGGWRTVTTKARMNQVSEYYGLGFRVYQKGGKRNWFVTLPTGETVPFADGMSFQVPATATA